MRATKADIIWINEEEEGKKIAQANIPLGDDGTIDTDKVDSGTAQVQIKRENDILGGQE